MFYELFYIHFFQLGTIKFHKLLGRTKLAKKIRPPRYFHTNMLYLKLHKTKST